MNVSPKNEPHPQIGYRGAPNNAYLLQTIAHKLGHTWWNFYYSLLIYISMMS